MKAIQIKSIGATDTKPSRLKAWTDCGSLVEPLNYSIDIREQALELAERYAKERAWPKVVGFGTLPCGDWVAVL